MSILRFRSDFAALSVVILFFTIGIPPTLAQTPAPPKPTSAVQALLDQAKPLRLSNNITTAEPLYLQALKQARAAQDKAGEARTLAYYSDLLSRKNEFAEALKMAEQARTLAHDLMNLGIEAEAWSSIGYIYYAQRKLPQTIEPFEKARALYHEAGDKIGEAGISMNLGIIYENSGDPKKAIPIYEKVLPIFRELKERRNEANTLTNLGLAYQKIQADAQAKSVFSQALVIYRELKDNSNQANILSMFAEYAIAEGEPQKALELGKQCLERAREAQNPRMEQLTQATLGDVYRTMGLSTPALQAYTEALTLARKLKNLRAESSSLNNMGIVYSRIGETNKAMEYFQQYIALEQQMGNKDNVVSGQANLGYACTELQRYQQAESYFQAALQGANELGNKELKATIMSGLASVAQSRKNYPFALTQFREALALYHTAGNKQFEAALLGNIGALYFDQKRYADAKPMFEQSLALYRQIGDRNGIANLLHDLGKLSRHTNAPLKQQEDYLRQSLNEAKATGNRLYIANAYQGLATVADLRKDYAQAVKLSAAGIVQHEALRAAFGGNAAGKADVLAAALPAYRNHLRYLLADKRASEAFDFAQKVKARSLLDTLAYGRVDLSSALTPDEQQQEQILREKADGLNQRMVQEGVNNEVGGKKRFAALKVELKAAEQTLQTFTEMLYARHPELVRRRVAQTATLKDMAALLPADRALLEYVFVDAKTLCVFVVTTKQGKPQVQAVEIPMKSETIQKNAAAFRLACADPHKEWKPQAHALYSQLIAPAVKYLRGKTRLIVCPDSVLWDVPFDALFDGRHTLGSRYTLSSAYSATGAQAAHTLAQERKRQTGSVLVVANPDFGTTKRFGDLNNLPGQRPISEPTRPLAEPARPLTEPTRNIGFQVAATVPKRGGYIAALAGTQREADAIKALFPDAEMLTQKRAQEATVKMEAGKFRYLHFATHGFVNDASPMLSSVVLAQPEQGSKEDGFLTAREVYELKLNAEMTVLSACNSGRGETRSGEGIVGLTWALLCAGCPTQVVSQWSVDDAATALLMGKFYANLKAGQGKSVALRNAAHTLQATPKYRHPYYWAAFVLMGEGK